VRDRNEGLTKSTLLMAATRGWLPEDSQYLKYLVTRFSHFAQSEEFKDGIPS